MLIKRGIKYGYPVETTAGEIQIAKPSNFTSIRLTPTNNKFVFYGTRHDILKWMNSHSELLVEYDPSDSEMAFSPPSSPLLFSPISITSTDSTISADSINSTNSTNSTDSNSTSSASSASSAHDITFDLFTIPAKTSSISSEDSTFLRPLNIALKAFPWVDVTLEIRPTDENKDSKVFPIHRVRLPSGSPLSKISKALEKSWKSLIPDQTAFDPDCFIRNNELLYPRKKPKLDSNNDENEEDNNINQTNKFVSEIAKHVPTVDLWLRQKQTSGDIPPGILTPYIIDDVLEELDDEPVKNQILLSKEKEAELDKELITTDLPKYETSFGDILLEGGKG